MPPSDARTGAQRGSGRDGRPERGRALAFELAVLPGGAVAVRDSKNPSGPHLCVTPGEWQAFKAGMTAGDFDNL